ncbi:MAG TPA: PBP1A family penicillin-binding protein [Vicinamibacterales bacterium]|nr:PBP1A family penicillin-binding protein [Vicinamibacterales bacterium]
MRRALIAVVAALVLGGVAATSYLWVSFGKMIDERLHGERERTFPRVYARPVEIRRGQSLSPQDLINRLNDLGYAQTPKGSNPGEFAVVRNGLAITPRGGAFAGHAVHVTFTPPPTRTRAATAPPPPVNVQAVDVTGSGKQDGVILDAPLLTALMTSSVREKRRHVPLSAIPKYMQQAVLSIEDQRFYSHPGINPIRFIGAAVRNVMGDHQVSGASTITEQLARMFFFEDEFNAEIQTGTRGKSWGSRLRRVEQAFMSLVLERRASKDEILEMYLNDVYLGQRGSFGIHGVAEAARIFFAKDVANISISEAATIAGTINSPISRSPFSNPKRALERRNVVIAAMASERYITEDQAAHASREPMQVVARAVDNEAPYFVDLVSEQLNDDFPGLTTKPGTLDVYTTLDLNMQRAALDAVRDGLANVDAQLAKRRRKPSPPPQAALIAVDPRTGEILAMVGGRSYNSSQFNRAISAHRQPGSVFKPFVYLAAFERAYAEGRTDFTPAAITDDSPATFDFNGQTWEPKNYDEYDGPITWRQALARSRNLGTIQVGYQVGFDNVAALWRKVGVGTPPQAYPSIALGVFELTPLEVATAYTLFTNDGSVRPLHAIDRIATPGKMLTPAAGKLKSVARADTTFLVTNMLRSVINEGTGAGARAAGFTLDAAGKSGTTNDLRDAWFVGFTPELLTVTWVGYDDNQPLRLTGSAAALPIWTQFMKRVLAGHGNRQFEAPEGITFVEIDKDTGKLATPNCPHVMTESFLSGSEPNEYCEVHR